MKERYEVEESESGASARPDAPTVATDVRRPQLSSSSATAPAAAASHGKDRDREPNCAAQQRTAVLDGRAARGPYAEFIVNAN